MRGNKKLISFMLVITLAASLFSACGSSKASPDSSSSSTKEVSSDSSATPAKEVTLNALFMKQAGYSEDDVAAMTNEFTKANPNIKINLTFVAYEELEPKILTAAKSGGYDIALGDAIWPPKFAKAGMVLDVTDKYSSIDKNDIFKGALDSVTYDGKQYGMPWLNDVKYLFYNKKMLKNAGFENPPKTWDELLTQAKAIKAKGLVQYPLAWSWNQAEALICDYTCIAPSFGGSFVNTDNSPNFANDGNKKALDFMFGTIKDGITNPKSTEMLENDVLTSFIGGNAAFALNWTFMYAAAKDPAQSKVVDDIGIAPIPGSGSVVSSTVNGGMPLVITAGCKNPDEAWKYISYLSSKEVQKKYAKNALPIWKSLYEDKDVIATNPDVVNISKVQYDYIVNRPQVPYYSELSTEMQVQLQKVLLGNTSSDDALKAIQQKALELAGKK